MAEVRRFEYRSLDLPSKVVIADIANDSARQHVLGVPQGFRDDVLNRHRRVSVVLAENAGSNIGLLMYDVPRLPFVTAPELFLVRNVSPRYQTYQR